MDEQITDITDKCISENQAKMLAKDTPLDWKLIEHPPETLKDTGLVKVVHYVHTWPAERQLMEAVTALEKQEAPANLTKEDRKRILRLIARSGGNEDGRTKTD